MLLMGEEDAHYQEHMADAVFCLALTGGGWGVRFKMALLCGCIPLLLSDDVLVSSPSHQKDGELVTPSYSSLTLYGA